MSDETNRSTINEQIVDGRKIIINGKTCSLRRDSGVTVIDDNGNEHIYYSFNIVNSNRKKLEFYKEPLTVTQFTTEERLHSICKRFENPAHMRPITYYSGVSSTNGLLYVNCPEPVRRWADILVDDEIELTIKRPDGLTYTDICHHVSMMKTSYLIQLSRLRRLFVNDDGSIEILSTAEFRSCDKSKLFVKKGDVVEVTINPDPEHQRFDLATEMKEKLQRDKRKVAE